MSIFWRGLYHYCKELAPILDHGRRPGRVKHFFRGTAIGPGFRHSPNALRGIEGVQTDFIDTPNLKDRIGLSA